MWELFGGSPDPVGTVADNTYGATTSFFTLPDFTQPTNFVELASAPALTAPDSGGWFSSVGDLFSTGSSAVANAGSTVYGSIANLFGGSSAPNSSANTSATGSGLGVLATVGSIFSGVEKAVAGFTSAAGVKAKNAATSTASFGGNLLGKFVGGVVNGAGLPTMLVILAVVGIGAYVWMKRL